MKIKSASASADYNYERITDITVSDLRRMGVEAIAMDLDDTATVYGAYDIESGVREWVDIMKDAGIKVMVVSNTVPVRGMYLAHKLGDLPVIAPAFKPSTSALKKASAMLGVPVSRIAMIGDQLRTDMLAANRAGAIGIRVSPVEKKKAAVPAPIGIAAALAYQI